MIHRVESPPHGVVCAPNLIVAFRGLFVRVSGLESGLEGRIDGPGRQRPLAPRLRPNRSPTGPVRPPPETPRFRPSPSGSGGHPRARQSGRDRVHVARRHHDRTLQGSGAGVGAELPAIRRRRLLPRNGISSGEEGIHDPGGRVYGVAAEKPTRPPIQNEATNGLHNARGTVGDGAARERSAARRRSSTSTWSTTGCSTTRAMRPTSSATPCSAACCPAWTSSIASPRVPTTSTADMEDVPVEPVIIKSVQSREIANSASAPGKSAIIIRAPSRSSS